MTTDTQLAPTDAEIDALWALLTSAAVASPTKFARAVLARWGQPAHSGEPVYAFRRKGLDDFCTCTEKRYEELSDKPTLFETRIFYTAPQPVERELLCSTELESYSDAYADTPDEAVAFRDGWRLAEQHYGITKGGQHGAE